MHSVFVWGSSCSNAERQGVVQPVALLRCWLEAQVASIAAFIPALFGLTSHLPLDNTPYVFYGVQIREVCWQIKQ